MVSRQYQFVDENGVKRRELTGISFFQFPKENCEIKRWCNLIHRQPGRDGFKLSGSTRVCIKHFLPESTNKAPGSTRSRRLPGSEPVLFSWNEFTLSTRKRKEPVERVFLPPTTPQQPPPAPEVLLDESSESEAPFADELGIDMEVETSANAADGTNVNASLLRRIEELENNLRDSRTKIAELEGELQKSQAREQVLHQRLY